MKTLSRARRVCTKVCSERHNVATTEAPNNLEAAERRTGHFLNCRTAHRHGEADSVTWGDIHVTRLSEKPHYAGVCGTIPT